MREEILTRLNEKRWLKELRFNQVFELSRVNIFLSQASSMASRLLRIQTESINDLLTLVMEEEGVIGIIFGRGLNCFCVGGRFVLFDYFMI